MSIRSALSPYFELSRAETGSGAALRPMEGLRGLAVLLVFLVHYVSLSAPWRSDGTTLATIASGLHTVGNAGVDLFFVLSGYLIYGSLLGRPQPLRHFLRRRVRRIYPVYACVFLIYLLLSWALPSQNRIPAPWPEALRYIAGNFFLLTGFGATPPFISVAWSLSYEMLSYLLIALLVGALRLRLRSRRWRCLFFACLGAAAAFGFATFGGPARMLLFIAGIFVHEAMAGPVRHVPGTLLASGAVLAAWTMLLLPLALWLKLAALCGAFFLLCFSCLRQPDSLLAQALCWTPLRWLGNISYSYYLIHGLALKAAFMALALLVAPHPHGAGFFMVMLAPMLAATLPPAVLLYLLVERPCSLAPAPANACVLPAAHGARS
ncbi:acyltransferase family protein [Janthinobacterium psychrotolerans]|uniref:Peptidoglycan/LPS O-acetylase OafA/YrhL n=1 Tax=Janthinobacterium psychrotolerans TaxID=1747903 RepID=A0A1A7BZH7_9BURK|nr:acyltransferase [Janthinobacterium psychrotolerans]OBV38164.1 Peptidoglycan/LPS O-acetylase OafA/YrhL [Janthinobacterium psychrotolerans]